MLLLSLPMPATHTDEGSRATESVPHVPTVVHTYDTELPGQWTLCGGHVLRRDAASAFTYIAPTVARGVRQCALHEVTCSTYPH
jgi:hypothetical protein